MNESLLWYNNPAEDFNSAIPVGNGRIGGMVYGKPENEIIQLNEDSVWSGGKRNRINPDAADGLKEVRQLIEEEKIPEAEQLAFRKLQGVTPDSRHYMPLGNLYIDMKLSGIAKEYKRGLDLENAVAFTEFVSGETMYKREVFVSEPDNVMVVHFTAENGTLEICASIDGRDDYYDDNRPVRDNIIMYSGGSGGRDGLFFAAALSASSSDGKVYTQGGKIYIENSTDAMLILGVRSSYYTEEAYEDAALMDVEYALECTCDELRYRHICDYGELYDRVSFSLNDNSEGGCDLPTDERILRMRGNDFDDKECDRHIHDNGLMVLYFNYARYLMISGSRPGSLPLNLQGIWNQDMQPKWGSRFVVNVNTQMNYWCAETCNLSECHEPLFDLLEKIREDGHVTAKEMYGCPGYVCHHNTDLWGDTAPQDLWMPATLWPMGGAWLALHVFEHYEYTQDKEFLKEKYSLMREAAEFFTDYLIEDREGRLVTCPSVSPENTYLTESGVKGCLCSGPSMDSQIITVLFNDVIKSSEILDIDHEFAGKLEKMLEKLPKPEIGKYGQIKEWAVDYDEVEIGHRHISQLFALYPADLITPYKTPKLADAARATLIRRLIHGGGHTGWSRAWITNMWARLFDRNMVYENLQKLIAYSTSPNMLNDLPPFQIDGNFGGAAGMVEALMQSHSGEINLLPALPEEWKKGEIKGLRAKGGFEVSIKWDEGKLQTAEIKSLCGNKCVLRPNTVASVSCDGKNVNSLQADGLVSFDTEKGRVYTIRS
ncbi:glycoside hydrolase family 95 protein [Porcipelethomonas sp.]|uniref:glycoside hydrolase family 95 protein n=1 Tax=Porcipelethomonas sp. TaxID=2981675 RepID=UPI003EF71318